jgi:RNA polymerase sigma-70 factor, ECF subfamily
MTTTGRTEPTDWGLLTRYKRGDVDALERLVERYRRPLYGFILNMTEGREDADEIFQEVWFRAIRKIGLYRRKNFCGWLMRIAHNLVIDRARRRKPDRSLDEEREDGGSLASVLPSGERGPTDNVQATDIGRAIAQAVETLPAEQKAVFLMRVKAELPFKEIAKIQGVSINTALARMQYALAKLRPLLKREYEALGR